MTDKVPGEPWTLAELKKAHQHAKLLTRGAARDSLALMAECLDMGKQPPQGFLHRWNHRFLEMFEKIQNDPAMFLAYWKELHDRVDGKPRQAVELENQDGTSIRVERVIRQIVDAPAQTVAPLLENKTIQ